MSIFDLAARALVAGISGGGGFFTLRWLVTFLAGRVDARQARLDRQGEQLDQGWRNIRKALEARLARIEVQNEALRVAFQHVSAALIGLDPQSPALATASRVLERAFPMDFTPATDRAEGAISRAAREEQ